jgi:hypothetical protein
MKKITLTTLVLSWFITAFAQNPIIHSRQVPQVRPDQNKPVLMKYQWFKGDEQLPTTQTVTSNSEIGKTTTIRGFSETTIGTTYYDLQTNNAISDRLQLNPDNNALSAIWTIVS